MNVLVILTVLVLGKGDAAVVERLRDQFVQETFWTGMGYTTALRFSPGNSHVFAAEKTGLIRLYASISAGESDYTRCVDLSGLVNSYHDHGLLGFNIHPQYPATPFVFAFFTANRRADLQNDVPILSDPTTCPVDIARAALSNPPDSRPWCEASGRLLRIRVDQTTLKGTIDQILISDWCTPAPAHHVDDLVWAPDGSLYVSAGDGAAIEGLDLGQPQDMCYVKTGPKVQGAFRAQSEQFLHGKILRVLPAALLASRTLVKGVDYTIVSKGHRNPYRLAVRPTTGDIFIADVGSDYVEEINVIANPLRSVGASVPNYGWPCYEGTKPTPTYGPLNLAECRTLTPDKLIMPFFAYNHGSGPDVPADERALCTSSSFSPTGVLFYGGSNWPQSQWAGTLIWLEGSQRCVYYFEKDASGNPDPTRVRTFVYTPDADADKSGLKPGQFVDITTGPDGNVYLVDYFMSQIVRLRYVAGRPPVASFTFDSVNSAITTFSFDAGESGTDISKYEWEFNGDGKWESVSVPTIQHTFTNPGIASVGLRITSNSGAVSDIVKHDILIGTKITWIVRMTPESYMWRSGDRITISVSASDNRGIVYDLTGASWTASVQHCSYRQCTADIDRASCEARPLAVQGGNNAISFVATQQQPPSFISVKISKPHPTLATTITKEIISYPSVTRVSLSTEPAGLELPICPNRRSSCDIDTVSGDDFQLTVPDIQLLDNRYYRFAQWIDASGAIITPSPETTKSNVTLRAVYTQFAMTTVDELSPPTMVSVTGQVAALTATWTPMPDVDYYVVYCTNPTTQITRAMVVPGSVSTVVLHLKESIQPNPLSVSVSIVQGDSIGRRSNAVSGIALAATKAISCEGDNVMTFGDEYVSLSKDNHATHPSLSLGALFFTLIVTVLIR